jgi:hypothetical protein
MLHRFATLLKNRWTLRQPGLHPIEHGFVLHAGRGSKGIVRATRTERAIATRLPVGVVDLLEPAQER